MIKNNYLELVFDIETRDAIFQTLEDWCITDYIQGLFCDTTASNIGRMKGVCIVITASYL